MNHEQTWYKQLWWAMSTWQEPAISRNILYNGCAAWMKCPWAHVEFYIFPLWIVSGNRCMGNCEPHWFFSAPFFPNERKWKTSAHTDSTKHARKPNVHFHTQHNCYALANKNLKMVSFSFSKKMYTILYTWQKCFHFAPLYPNGSVFLLLYFLYVCMMMRCLTEFPLDWEYGTYFASYTLCNSFILFYFWFRSLFPWVVSERYFFDIQIIYHFS